jgi:hypothetical protein
MSRRRALVEKERVSPRAPGGTYPVGVAFRGVDASGKWALGEAGSTSRARLLRQPRVHRNCDTSYRPLTRES